MTPSGWCYPEPPVNPVPASHQLVDDALAEVLAGRPVPRAACAAMIEFETPADILYLAQAANRIRDRFMGAIADLCTLVNAKSGACIEDCAFCSQSSRYKTESPVYPLLPVEQMVAAAKKAEASGAHNFCIVCSGDAPREDELPGIAEAVRRIVAETSLQVTCSLGALTEPQVAMLKAAGMTRYNHNIETAKSHFHTIVTSHTFDDRVRTIRNVHAQGLEACCGGIIGMGESRAQRLEFAFQLRELGTDCFTLNILNPRPGTPLADVPPLTPLEILKTIAVFRFIIPDKILKLSGGREANLRDLQGTAMLSGANGLITGGYLTTAGQGTDKDLRMLEDAGLDPAKRYARREAVVS